MKKYPTLKTTFDTNIPKPVIDEHLAYKLYVTKNKINNHKDDWNHYRSLINDYELIGNFKIIQISKIIPICRSYFKLWEINQNFNIIPKDNKKISIATLCEAPGSFCQAIIHTRQEIFKENKVKDNIYGISLKKGTNKHTRWKQLPEEKEVSINRIFGDPLNQLHDGNIKNPDIVYHFINKVKNDKCSLITADGGLEIALNMENYKEQLHYDLFLNEALMALSVQKKGGNFVLKIYDIFTLATMQLLYLLKLSYENFEITKPLTSRTTNSEKYVICSNFKDNLPKDYLDNLLEMCKKLWNYNDNEFNNITYIHSIFENNYINSEFVNYIKKINNIYIVKQIDKINETLELIDLKKKSNLTFNEKYKELISNYRKNQISLAYTWVKLNNLPHYTKK